MSWHSFTPYVSAAERKRQSQEIALDLRKKGQKLNPVKPEGRKITKSFWGNAWCEHLESYSDFENRLPRGRTYLRNGSVIHLTIEAGRIDALVTGSELYKQSIHIKPLPLAKWKALKKRCQGKVGSLLELLQGRISDEVMANVTNRTDGLFPSPKEIKTDCDCPDWAGLCKHLAAVLYGVGTLLDSTPQLLFKLRGVDQSELIQADTDALVQTTSSGSRRRTLAPSTLSDVFGIELDESAPAPSPRSAKTKKKINPTIKRTTKNPTPANGTTGTKQSASTTKAKKSVPVSKSQIPPKSAPATKRKQTAPAKSRTSSTSCPTTVLPQTKPTSARSRQQLRHPK